MPVTAAQSVPHTHRPLNAWEGETVSWLRVVRMVRGMSVRDLADAAGISPNALSNAENLHRMPHPTTRRCLAQALDVPEAMIFPPDARPYPMELLARYIERRAAA